MTIPSFSKPDYTRWDGVDEFILRTAAFLVCDIEPWPPAPGSPDPVLVEEMLRRIHHEVPFTPEPPRTGPVVRVSPAPRAHRFRREDLRAWAESRDLRPPFLFADAREQDKPKTSAPEPYSDREEKALLRILAALLAEKHGEGIIRNLKLKNSRSFGDVHRVVHKWTRMDEKTLRKYLSRLPEVSELPGSSPEAQ